jgi:hypothetical protein
MPKSKPPLTLTPDLARRLLEIRAQQDPLRTFEPGPTQLACRLCPAMIRLLSGGNRSGKSTYGAVEVVESALRRHPTRSTQINGLYIIFAISREQIKDVWHGKLRKESKLKGANFSRPMIPDSEVEQEYYTYGAGAPTIKEIKLKNGNSILFAVSGDKNVWKRVQGKDFVLGILVDEQAGTQELIDECLARLLDVNSSDIAKAEGVAGWFLWTASETMVNPTWDKLKQQAQDGDPRVGFFAIGADENPAISIDERRKLKGLMSDEAYEIRMEGGGSAAGNMLVYPQFSDEKHLRQEDYEPTDTDTLWIGYDPGTNYTGIVFAAFSRDKPHKMRVFKCIQPRRQTLEADVQDICNVLRGRFIEGLVYDQAARKIEKVGTSVFFKLRQLLMASGVKIWRDLMMGESQYERGVPKVRYLLDPGTGKEPLFELNPSSDSGCARLRQQIKSYRFTQNAHELKGDNILRGDDHLLDAWRYLATRQPCWIDRGPNPANPNWRSPIRHDPTVMSDQALIERQKAEMSALIAKGKLPNYTSRPNLRWRR